MSLRSIIDRSSDGCSIQSLDLRNPIQIVGRIQIPIIEDDVPTGSSERVCACKIGYETRLPLVLVDVHIGDIAILAVFSLRVPGASVDLRK